MNGVWGGQRLYNCTHADCGATFSREWKLKEHETVHTGARPCLCPIAGCGRRFKRRSHLRRHWLKHTGVKPLQCTIAGCAKTFFFANKLKGHLRVAHGENTSSYKCSQPNCTLSFKKRRLLKLHLQKHNVPANFKCSKDGCAETFDSHVARKAHEKKHAGYPCPHNGCQVQEQTWGKLQKHLAKHPATHTCSVCKKVFKKARALQRHKRTHASHKPVLLCPRDNCQAYFSTTFNMEHHIRKVHLKLLKYKCFFPDCPRMFAMRKRRRSKKTWQKRLDGNNRPLIEENLGRLFALRMRISRRAKVETNLSGLFNERKIPHYVDPEVNLRGLFGLKQPRLFETPEAALVES